MERERVLALVVSQLHYYGLPAAAEVLAATAVDRGLALEWMEPSSELADLCALGLAAKEDGGDYSFSL
jgi:hypothetical protein